MQEKSVRMIGCRGHYVITRGKHRVSHCWPGVDLINCRTASIFISAICKADIEADAVRTSGKWLGVERNYGFPLASQPSPPIPPQPVQLKSCGKMGKKE